MFERLVSVRLGRFVECSCVLPATQFAYRKGLVTCDALLCMSHTLQIALNWALRNFEKRFQTFALENMYPGRIVRIDFSAAFDRVNHRGIFYKLYSVGIGGSVLSILTQFLLDRSQRVIVDGCWSILVNVVSEVKQGSVLSPLLFLLCTMELFSILAYKLISYADDSTLMVVVPSPGIRVTLANTLIRDLGRVSEWYDHWGIKLNASKTKTMIVSRSRTKRPSLPH